MHVGVFVAAKSAEGTVTKEQIVEIFAAAVAAATRPRESIADGAGAETMADATPPTAADVDADGPCDAVVAAKRPLDVRRRSADVGVPNVLAVVPLRDPRTARCAVPEAGGGGSSARGSGGIVGPCTVFQYYEFIFDR